MKHNLMDYASGCLLFQHLHDMFHKDIEQLQDDHILKQCLLKHIYDESFLFQHLHEIFHKDIEQFEGDHFLKQCLLEYRKVDVNFRLKLKKCGKTTLYQASKLKIR